MAADRWRLVSALVLAWVVLAGMVQAAPAPDAEVQVGQNAAHDLERRWGVCTDAQANARVARLANVVLRAANWRGYIRIRILNASEPNGIALPGGYIYVSRGLLRLLPEDELLCAALAHEIAHIALGHMSQMLREREQPPARDGGSQPDAGAPGAGPQDVRRRAPENPMHAREKEADRAAARYLCAANIDPRVLLRLLARLSRQPELDATASLTHPTWEERIRSVSAYIESPEFQAQMSSWAPFRRELGRVP